LESLPFRQIDSSAAADKARQDPMVRKVETMLEAKMQLVKAHTDKGNTYYGNNHAACYRHTGRLVYIL
jgi:hypothetical protein